MRLEIKNRQKISILWLSALILSACSSDESTSNGFGQTEQQPFEQPSADRFSIAGWNLKTYGQAEASDPNKLNAIATVIHRYDLVFLQEIRDISGESQLKLLNSVENLQGIDWSLSLSPRLGSAQYKEQYGVIYRNDRAQLNDFYIYGDQGELLASAFERPPMVSHFTLASGEQIVLAGLHADPDQVPQELGVLHHVINGAKQHYNEDDIITLGDLNADCDYINQSEMSTLTLRNEADYLWLIEDTEDTAVSPNRHCAYDRIIQTGSLPIEAFIDKTEPNNEVDYNDITDHYPVELYILSQ